MPEDTVTLCARLSFSDAVDAADCVFCHGYVIYSALPYLSIAMAVVPFGYDGTVFDRCEMIESARCAWSS